MRVASLSRNHSNNGDDGKCVAFHCDFSRRTMQVALNDPVEYDGGLLVFATPQGFVAPARNAGAYTIHNHKSVHGVTSLTRGVRYGLFLCRLADDDDDDEKDNETAAFVRELSAAVREQLDFYARALAFLRRINDDAALAAAISTTAASTPPSLTAEIVSHVCRLRPLAAADSRPPPAAQKLAGLSQQLTCGVRQVKGALRWRRHPGQ